MKTTNLSSQVAAGEPVKPWLMLGPFYEDMSGMVQGLTLFEKAGASVGRSAMTQIIEEAMPIIAASPHESEEATFRGQAQHWSLTRRPEKYLSWGRYNISNHLGAVFLSTIVTPGKAGVHHWQLLTRITSRAIVAINGSVVFDTDAHPVEQAGGGFEYVFDAALKEGDNIVTIGLFRLGRMAQVGMRLTCDAPVAARVAPVKGLNAGARSQVESELASIRLARDIFYPEHAVGFTLGVAPGAETTMTASLCSAQGKPLCDVAPLKAGQVTLCQGKDLSNAAYQIICTWTDKAGGPITSTSFDIRKITPLPAMPGYERLSERKRTVLEEATADTQAAGHGVIWPEVARYALGRFNEVSEKAIADLCAFIAARKDCADFGIQGMLRIMCWEREQQRLSPWINALMKDTVLGFKYWVDEPGDTVMYMGSENHRLLFHVAEWMAGQLFPTEEFTNSRMRGLYHATKGRTYIAEWLRQRGRFGFDEFHSNSYYPVNIAPLINVYDFAIYEDAKLKQMAGAVLDYAFFNLAADSLNGVFGTAHGRSYGINLKYPDMEGTSATCWLLYGAGTLNRGTSGMSQVAIATSGYKLPPILAAIATDSSAVVESKIRQGILPGTAPNANFCVYRTPDYMMSALQDYRKGEYESSSHVAQVTLGNKAVVFWSCPHTSGEGSGLRPDYWSGHTTLPRAVQYRNVMSITWRLTPIAWMSHCFLEQERFDEVRFSGNWACARVGAGYVAIYSQNGMALGASGQYAGRELVCSAPENTWLVECGREADWGSFDAFVEAVTAASIESKDGVTTYVSPSIGSLVTGWDVTPTVNAEPIALRGYPLVESAWASSAFGSGEMTIRHGGESYEIWFNQ
jgi:hypothetical protein